jgi:hypothetical protein
MDSKDVPARESLLPYEAWAAEALRHVMVQALVYVARHGLPGGHHFYLTFRTDYAGVEMPRHLRQRFSEQMTIVLQHQFWDLSVDEAAGRFRVGLSFGGVPATLTIPFAAVTSFADPEVQFGLSFAIAVAETTEASGTEDSTQALASSPEQPEEAEEVPQVVSLEAFRRRPAPKE